MTEGLTEDEEDVVDAALQQMVDWGDVAGTVTDSGRPAIRSAQRSIDEQIGLLNGIGLVLMGGEREGRWAGGAVRGKIAVLHVVRPEELGATFQRVEDIAGFAPNF